MSHMIKPVATLGASPSRAAYSVHNPYAIPARSLSPSNDDSISDDGSLGPQDFIAPSFDKNQILKPTNVDASSAASSAAEELTTSTTTATQPTRKAPLSASDALDVFTRAMSYLRLEDIEVAREASPLFAAAANRVAPKPLDSDDIVFVRWEPQQLHTAMPAPAKTTTKRGGAPTAAPAVFPWRCLACGQISVGPRQCQHCRSPLAESACRVFIGQLRKELSAELATALVRSLASSNVTILHMESHTNGADGRGKGCAWAYVNSVEDALRVTALHKRVFVDLDEDDNEGFWFIKDPALAPQLGAFADTIGAARTRPVWLPRQPLVAELPAKSMLAQFVKQTYGPYPPQF